MSINCTTFGVSAFQQLLPVTLLQPTTVMAVLSVLPPSVRWLELAVSPCAGPLLPALARYSQLEQLDITGNGAAIRWDAERASVLAPLRQLHMDFRRVPGLKMDVHSVGWLPTSAAQALSAATALHTLEVRVMWSYDVAALCRALPALRQLK